MPDRNEADRLGTFELTISGENIMSSTRNTRTTASPWDTTEPMTDHELTLVIGAGDVWVSSDQATEHYNELVEQFNQQMDNAVEGAMNLEMGTATRNASDAWNTYGELQDAMQAIHTAVDNDAANYDHEGYLDDQIQNGHDYSPSDANMTNSDGSPGKGDSGSEHIPCGA